MLVVRSSNPADHAALAALFEEMQAHYDVWCPPNEEIRQRLAAPPHGTEILVAETEAGIVAFAGFSALFPGPGLNGGLFLKEIYVSRAHRGSGAGKALLGRLAAIALERGLKRVDWTADAHNPALLAFYESLGAKQKPDKLFFRLDGEALMALGQGGEPAR